MESSQNIKKRFPSGPYFVTDEALSSPLPLATVVSLALQGGVKVIQLREKNLETKDFVRKAQEYAKLVQELGGIFLINDRVDVALACHADGVHLGQRDMPVKEARSLLGPGAYIGLSLESKEEFYQMEEEYLDYIALSPIFPTATKSDTKGFWGLQGLEWARSKTNLPIVAIGGIHGGNAKEVLASGADSLAVVSYLCTSSDPKSQAEHLSSFFR